MTSILPYPGGRGLPSGDVAARAGHGRAGRTVTAISFRPLAEADLPRLHAWLQQPHVRRWWREGRTYEETVARYLPAIRGEEPSDHYVIVVDGRDAGMIQTYLVSDYADWDAIVGAGEGVAGIDLLLGEPDLVGRGLGARVLAAFAREVVFARTGTHAVFATVEEANGRSLGAFANAGFRHVRDVEEDGRPHRLLRLDRDG
jgi:aminoglycoside 6'-N-acetyltransferase